MNSRSCGGCRHTPTPVLSVSVAARGTWSSKFTLQRSSLFGVEPVARIRPVRRLDAHAGHQPTGVGLRLRERCDSSAHEHVASVPAADADPAAPARIYIKWTCAVDCLLTNLQERGAAFVPPEMAGSVAHISSLFTTPSHREPLDEIAHALIHALRLGFSQPESPSESRRAAGCPRITCPRVTCCDSIGSRGDNRPGPGRRAVSCRTALSSAASVDAVRAQVRVHAIDVRASHVQTDAHSMLRVLLPRAASSLPSS
jgi:hypothetical protein